MMRFPAVAVVAAMTVVVALLAPGRAGAQIVPFPVGNAVGGVKIDAEGQVHARQTDQTNDLAAQRLRGKALAQAPKGQGLTYVSVPRVLAAARSHLERKEAIPDNLKYLSGLTQIRYVFVYPEEQDLVIAGPAEAFDAKNALQPTGKVTGRPVLHLEDLVVALRVGASPGGRWQPFGCSIDPTPDALERSTQVMKDQANATRGARMKAMVEALGPQRVSTFGAPADSRFEFVTVAADYRLKRICLGLDAAPVPGVGSAVDASRAAGNRFWFEADYQPLLVSAEGDAFEIRGPRLVLKAGALSFDPKGATETAKEFAKRFSSKVPQLATVVPAFADLQNVADLALVAALVRQDGLAKKGGLDLAWLADEKNFPTTKLPAPRTAETLVNFTNGSIVAGGVSLEFASVVAPKNRERDEKAVLAPARVRPSGDNWYKVVEGAGEKAAAAPAAAAAVK